MSVAPDAVDGQQPRGVVSPVLPLSLLLAIRAHDRPGEVLEDEDLTASLPRRLGLKGVVDNQIRAYEQAVRRGRKIAAGDAANLIRLVLRRPDAEAILRDTGERVAESFLRRGPASWRRMVRRFPRRAAFAVARRASRKVLRELVGAGRIEVAGKPLALRVRDGLPTVLDRTGVTCVLYDAVIEALVEAYVGQRPRIVHRPDPGARSCEWMLAEG